MKENSMIALSHNNYELKNLKNFIKLLDIKIFRSKNYRLEQLIKYLSKLHIKCIYFVFFAIERKYATIRGNIYYNRVN